MPNCAGPLSKMILTGKSVATLKLVAFSASASGTGAGTGVEKTSCCWRMRVADRSNVDGEKRIM